MEFNHAHRLKRLSSRWGVCSFQRRNWHSTQKTQYCYKNRSKKMHTSLKVCFSLLSCMLSSRLLLLTQVFFCYCSAIYPKCFKKCACKCNLRRKLSVEAPFWKTDLRRKSPCCKSLSLSNSMHTQTRELINTNWIKINWNVFLFKCLRSQIPMQNIDFTI